MPARQVLYCLSHASNPFLFGYFGERVLLFYLGWPTTIIVLIRIIGVSPQHLVYLSSFSGDHIHDLIF
jgi:hypothetical protein